MSPRHIRRVPVTMIIGFIVGGLVLMVLYRPLPLGVGVFLCGLVLLHPAAKWARRTGVASGAPADK